MAIYAHKFRLAFAVSLIGISTRGTFAACILWVNRIYRNALQFGFVFNKRPQFKETPTAMPCSLGLSNSFLGSVSNAFEIFKRKSRTLCLSLIYKVFCYAVVFKVAEILFTSAKPFQQFVNRAGTFTRLRLFACLMLQSLSQLRVFLPNSFHFRACKSLACGVSRQINNSKINADNIVWDKRRIFGNVTNAIQKELSFAVNQIYFAFAMLKQFSLMLTHYKRNVKATFNSPEINQIIRFKSDNTVVVSNRAVFFEKGLFFGLNFVTISDLRNQPNDHLSGQIKSLFGFFVNNLVQVKLLENLVLKRLLANPIRRFVGFFKRLKQSGSLAFERFQFEIHNQFHIIKYRLFVELMQAGIDSNAFLRRLEVRRSPAVSL